MPRAGRRRAVAARDGRAARSLLRRRAAPGGGPAGGDRAGAARDLPDLAPGGGPGRLAALARPLAALLAEPAALERAALALLDRLAEERPALLGRGLFVAEPGDGTPLRLAPGVLHALVPEADGGASLRWAGAPLALDAAQAGWVERLAEGATPAELGDGALAFCRRLRRRGLVVPG
jgi:hypothetical protein